MRTLTPYRIERAATLAQLDALEREWGDLIHDVPDAPIFLTWEWIRTWWVQFGGEHELWVLTVRDKEARLVGVAPFMQQITRVGLMKLRVLSFIGTGSVCPVHLSILAQESNRERICQALLGILLDRSKPWDAIRIPSAVSDSASHSVWVAAGASACTWAQTTVPYIPLPGNWNIYLATVSKKLRRNLKYFRSKLEGDHAGQVRFELVTEEADLQDAMRRLGELNTRRWHARKLSTPFSDPAYCIFHSGISSMGLRRGWLRLYTLRVEQSIIALFYCFNFHGRIYAYQIGFDLDWSRYSPGRLVIAYGIELAIKEGASELDWGPGNDDYKLAWTEHVRVEADLLLANNWKGRLLVRWESLLGRLKIRAKQWLPASTQLWLNQLRSEHSQTMEAAGNQVQERD